MKSALIVGSAMASFTVEKFGTQRLEEVTEAEMIGRIKQFKELTTFEVKLPKNVLKTQITMNFQLLLNAKFIKLK